MELEGQQLRRCCVNQQMGVAGKRLVLLQVLRRHRLKNPWRGVFPWKVQPQETLEFRHLCPPFLLELQHKGGIWASPKLQALVSSSGASQRIECMVPMVVER